MWKNKNQSNISIAKTRNNLTIKYRKSIFDTRDKANLLENKSPIRIKSIQYDIESNVGDFFSSAIVLSVFL